MYFKCVAQGGSTCTWMVCGNGAPNPRSTYRCEDGLQHTLAPWKRYAMHPNCFASSTTSFLIHLHWYFGAMLGDWWNTALQWLFLLCIKQQHQRQWRFWRDTVRSHKHLCNLWHDNAFQFCSGSSARLQCCLNLRNPRGTSSSHSGCVSRQESNDLHLLWL